MKVKVLWFYLLFPGSYSSFPHASPKSVGWKFDDQVGVVGVRNRDGLVDGP